MGDKRFDIPDIAQGVDKAVRNPVMRLTQAVRQLLGFGGDPRDAALTLRNAGASGLIDLLLPQIVFPDAAPDLTPPPTPTGLVAGAALTHLFVSWDAPGYTQGHGHGQTNIYAVQRDPASTDPLPTFGDSVPVYSAPGFLTVAAIPSEPNTRWHVWIKWQSLDGVESAAPAGGTNGAVTTTGQDVHHLLDALTRAATDPASPYTKVGFRADLFYIAPVADYFQDATPVGLADGELWFSPSAGVTQTWDSAGAGSWEPFDTPLPFIVNTMPTVINGVTVPAGVYMNAAFIYDLTASIARLGTAWIDNAMVANLSAAKLTVGDGTVGGDLKSTVFTSGSTGWRIRPDGTAEFSGVIVRGTVYASAGLIGGITIGSTAVYSSNYVAATSGWRIHSDGTAEFNDIYARGNIVASSIEVGSSPAISGTTMTGSGAVIDSGGTFALGDSTTNVTYNGSVLKLNGEVADVSNLKANSASLISSAVAGAWGVVAKTITITAADIPAGETTVPVIVTGGADTLISTFFDIGEGQGPLYTSAGNLLAAQPPTGGVDSFPVVFDAAPGTYTFACFNHGTGDAADVANTRKRTITVQVGKR